MTYRTRILLGLICLPLALASQVAAALEPGQRLTKAQVAQWPDMTQYDIGNTRLWVIPDPAPAQETWLLNRQNVVGFSRNEVALSGATADVLQAGLQQTRPQPLSVQHYAPTQIVVARYADFAAAVEGLQALKAALPDATVRLQVQFSKQIPQ